MPITHASVVRGSRSKINEHKHWVTLRETGFQNEINRQQKIKHQKIEI